MNNGNTEASKKSSGFDYQLDPNRVRTDAEVATFAKVFKITIEEARNILKKAGEQCQS